jgi:putative hydrolase of the HAD superfamily
MTRMPLLLVDLDNTVADREAAFEFWCTRKLATWAPADPVARAFLVSEDQDGFRPRREFLASVAARFTLDESVDVLLAEYRQLTWEGFPHVSDDIQERLASMRRDGWRVGVVTNGEAGVQEATVERVGLVPLLDACVVSGTVGIRKPDPRIFELAAQQCGEPLEGAWMVGDGEVDITGAAAAGIRSVWLTRGRSWQHQDVQPTLLADRLCDALARVAASCNSPTACEVQRGSQGTAPR